MNIDEFLNQCRDQWPSFDDVDKLSGYLHPRDRFLAHLPDEIQGMATENKLMLLNLALKNLAPDEVYVEIGCWRGLSLAGAALNNREVPIYACDDFSQFNGSAAKLEKTIEQYTAPSQVHFYDMNYLSFFALAPWKPFRIGAYFYDGGHSFEEQYQALAQVLPWLSDHALVIIDDTNAGQVRSANKLLALRVPELRLLSDVQTPGNEFPTWWNGVQIYRYEAGSVMTRAPKRDVTHGARRLFWDGIMPPARQLNQSCRRLAAAVPGLRPLYKRVRLRFRSGV